MENHTPPAWHQKPFLSVGDVSEICHLSRRTLRHYDNIGLLKPEKVDGETGYRYYGRAQIFYVSVIQDLKSLGFSLPEIKEALLPENLEKLKNLYRKKHLEVQTQIKTLSQIEERLHFRLDLIERIQFLEQNLSDFPDLHVELKTLPERQIVFTRYKSSLDFEGLALRIQELYSLIEKYQLNAFGPYMLIFHNDYQDSHPDPLEMAIALKEKDPRELPCTRPLPSGLYACTVFFGPHEKTFPAYEKLLSWLHIHHYKITGPAIKIYTKSLAFTDNTEKLLCEIQIPVQKTPQTLP